MNTATDFPAFFLKHADVFNNARRVCKERNHWTAFADSPAAYPNHEQAQENGLQAFQQHINTVYDIDQPGILRYIGSEVSPYTKKSLGIQYPLSDLDALFDAAEQSMHAWSCSSIENRIGILLEAIQQIYTHHIFELTHAVMHTTGQSFNMAYTGSGANALDRGIEALVYAYEAMASVTTEAHWARQFGSASVALEKTYRLIPKGVAVCFSCASFPTWNALPSIMASLATGNAVIVKAHPATILPVALVIRVIRKVLEENNFSKDLITLALDTPEHPIGKDIIKHPKTAIVDFTGSVNFGRWVEQNAYPAICFTETAGCNTVVISEVDDLKAVMHSLATTICMFSAQMCTSPQNIYISKHGVKTPDGIVSFEDVTNLLVESIKAIATNPKRASMILATIQSDATLSLIKDIEQQVLSCGSVLLESHSYPHPSYPDARTATPLVVQVTTAERHLYSEEKFGPIVFVIACESDEDALRQATQDVREFGGLTAFAYAKDSHFVQQCEDLYARAGAQLTLNLTGPMPLNFAAAYSDYHVTGLNSAGNASLTDASFIAGRFRIAQSRKPV